MKKRQIKKNQQKQDEKKWKAYFDDLKELPVWYWKRGLHDAKILDVKEFGNGVDKKRGKYYQNCLVFFIDSSGAIYETDIKKIIFYNYEIKMADISVSELSEKWWMCDTIERRSDRNYLLNFEVDPENGDRLCFSIEFEYIDVERQ